MGHKVKEFKEDVRNFEHITSNYLKFSRLLKSIL